MVVVLALGAVVADRAARGAAERRVAARVAPELSPDRPLRVHLGGRSFLVQAVRGHYEEVDVSAPSMTWEDTTVRDVELHVRGIDVPRTVLRGRGGAVHVDGGTARALLPWSLLGERASAATGAALELDAGPEGTVRATTSVGLLGREVDVSLRSAPDLADGEVLLEPVAIAVGGRELSLESARRPLRALGLDDVLRPVRLPLDDVPRGVTPTRLRVVDGGIVVDADLAAQVVQVPPAED